MCVYIYIYTYIHMHIHIHIHYIYIYIYICIYVSAGPSCNQLPGYWQDWQDWEDLQDWQSTAKGDFGYPNLLFGTPGGSILGPRDTILVIQGSPGTPNRTSWGPDLIFIDFGWILGPSWDLCWSHFGDFFVIWGSKVAV